MSTDPVLMGVAVGHLLLAAICLAWQCLDAAPILGVHPGLKPMKFSISIALFLGTMAILVPCISLGEGPRRVVSWTLAMSMALEMLVIVTQALRGTSSHFNRATSFDAAMWKLMIVAIVVAAVGTLAVAVLAMTRPLSSPDGRPMSPLLATAWRAGLVFFVFGAFTGFRMGSQLAHSVGGLDGGPGMPVVNWSTQHGDLRAAHFVGLHALQSLPLAAALLDRTPWPGAARWASMLLVLAAHILVAAWTTLRALAGLPAW